MKLLTKEIERKLPKLGATDGEGYGATAYLKLFFPAGRYTLYVTEYDGEDTLFGYCLSPLGEDCDEFGYSSLAELAETKGPFGLGIERDTSFKPTVLRECAGVK